MAQVESLTVQILGDSSGLQQELNSVADLLDSLVSEITSATEGVGAFGDSLGNLAAAMTPLQGLSSQLGVISQQLQQISSQPLTLNVQPALQAIATLIQSAQAANMQLQALSAAPMGMGMGAGMPMDAAAMMGGIAETSPRRMFASGGLVSGPSGIDQVPARLTAGEFVLNADAVASLGLNRLDEWNRGANSDTSDFSGRSRRDDVSALMVGDLLSSNAADGMGMVTRSATELPVPAPPERIAPRPDLEGMNRNALHSASLNSARGSGSDSAFSPLQQTTNHFGGIEIHVKEGGEVSDLLDDLRRQGIGIRQRRG